MLTSYFVPVPHIRARNRQLELSRQDIGELGRELSFSSCFVLPKAQLQAGSEESEASGPRFPILIRMTHPSNNSFRQASSGACADVVREPIDRFHHASTDFAALPVYSRRTSGV